MVLIITLLQAKRFENSALPLSLNFGAKPCIQLFSLHNCLLLCYLSTFLKNVPNKFA